MQVSVGQSPNYYSLILHDASQCKFHYFCISLTLILVQVSERDDKLLAEHMAKLRSENGEVDGDVGSEEEEDTGMGEIDLDRSSIGITE